MFLSPSAAVATAAAMLTRPRIAAAYVVVSAAAAISLGFYLFAQHHAYHDRDDQQDENEEPAHISALHRSNAVRHSRRRTQLHQDDLSGSEENDDQNASDSLLAHILGQFHDEQNENLLNVEIGTRNGDGDGDRDDNGNMDSTGTRIGMGGQHGNDNENENENDVEDWPQPESNGTRQRMGENIVTLLFRVSEDNARRNAYVHRGCQCNGCGMVPIRGIRYRCANCADFDLCEVCESHGLHQKTHIFYKVRVPAPPFGPRQLQPAWYPGHPERTITMLPKNLVSKYSHDTGFERVELDAFWEQWTFMANTEWHDDPDGLHLAMDRRTFERCLVPSGGYRHAAPNLIHDRMFAFYDTNKDDLIGFEEFLHGVSYRKRKDKLRRTFDGYDIDGDGFVNRRDFLRMFRAYYVLYKQMHKDILEGLDDHVMSSTDAQQIIASRAPLSKYFGRDTRYPAGDSSRPMEGKMFHSNGEVNVRDDRDAVLNDDKPDTANREEILSTLFTGREPGANPQPEYPFVLPRPRPHADPRYWSAIVSPPEDTAELGSLVNREHTHLEDTLSLIRGEEAALARGPLYSDETVDSSSDNDNENDEDESRTEEPSDSNNEPWTPRRTSEAMPDSDSLRFALPAPSQDLFRERPQPSITNQSRVGSEKRKRIQARKLLYERWQRRQFYLDEEEGALPPQGWKEEEDVLANVNNPAELSKSNVSAVSRSSSRVRFAEDLDGDEFDVRSNPSSSKSVPERWGGMEIPDAERDAGKEILYQVTQQAFNELLDQIFEEKETIALHCAETKQDRDKYRHLFDHLDIQLDWVESTEFMADPPPESDNQVPPASERNIKDQTLDELLDASGYAVANSQETTDNHGDNEEPVGKAPVLDSQPETAASNDPTMPQFMPNTAAELHHRTSSRPQAPKRAADAEAARGAANPSVPSKSKDKAPNPQDKQISPKKLNWWKRLDLAEEQARARGGWGKLSYAEFAEIYKQYEFVDSSRNRLDYLGSWIDFCIP